MLLLYHYGYSQRCPLPLMSWGLQPIGWLLDSAVCHWDKMRRATLPNHSTSSSRVTYQLWHEEWEFVWLQVKHFFTCTDGTGLQKFDSPCAMQSAVVAIILPLLATIRWALAFGPCIIQFHQNIPSPSITFRRGLLSHCLLHCMMHLLQCQVLLWANL